MVQGEFLVDRKKVKPYFFPGMDRRKSLAEPDDFGGKGYDRTGMKATKRALDYAIFFRFNLTGKGAHHV